MHVFRTGPVRESSSIFLLVASWRCYAAIDDWQVRSPTVALSAGRRAASLRAETLPANQANICRTFRLILLPAIQPFHCANRPSTSPSRLMPGQSFIQSGQVPSSTFGTPCQAYRLSPLINTASPDLSLMTATLAPSLSRVPSSPAMKMPSQPNEILTSGWSHSSLTSRCRLSVSPGE